MYEYKKVSKLGKLYLLPKIHKTLHNFSGRPLISNCGTPTEKASENYHFKLVMQRGKSYMKEVILSTKLKTYKTFQRMQFWLQRIFILVFHTKLVYIPLGKL